MIEQKEWHLAMATMLVGATLSGCKLSDLTDDDDDTASTEAVLLQGNVMGPGGEPAFGATVDIQDAWGDKQRLTTDEQGNFIWRKSFDEEDLEEEMPEVRPFFGLKAPVVLRATINGEENVTYYSVLCNTVYASGNRVNANAVTHYVMDEVASIDQATFDNWNTWDEDSQQNIGVQTQDNYCNQDFAETLTEVSGSLDGGFNVFNSDVETLSVAAQTAIAGFDAATFTASENPEDVVDSLGSLYTGYAGVAWTLAYNGTIDGEPKEGSENYTFDDRWGPYPAISTEQLKEEIRQLADDSGVDVDVTLDSLELTGTRLGDAGTEVIAKLAGTVDALGQEKDFDLELTFTAEAAL